MKISNINSKPEMAFLFLTISVFRRFSRFGLKKTSGFFQKAKK